MPHVPADERREQLIDATLAVMAEHGLDAATSRRIAEAAQAPLASIHYTFGSLEALLAAAYARALDQMLDRLDGSIPRDRGYTVAFAALADAVVDVLVDPAAGILFLELNPAHHEHLADVGARYYEVGHELVQSVAAASQRPVPPDAEQLGRLVIVAVDGVATHFAVHRDEVTARADLGRLLSLLVPPDH